MSHAYLLPTIREQWEGFARIAIPPGASVEQHNSMRDAFYGGALVILQTTLMIAEIDDEGEAMAALERYHAEVARYSSEINERVANAHPKEKSDD